jgi:hypothetical protein
VKQYYGLSVTDGKMIQKSTGKYVHSLVDGIRNLRFVYAFDVLMRAVRQYVLNVYYLRHTYSVLMPILQLTQRKTSVRIAGLIGPGAGYSD